MEFQDNSRQARLFFWSLGIWDEFTEKESQWLFGRGTNLCHFVRVICFYMPLVFFLHLLLVAAAIFLIVVLPFIWFGWKNIGIVTGGGSIIIIAIVAVFVLVGWLRSHKPATASKIDRQPVASQATKEPGFLKIIWLWAVAVKKRICPEVHFYSVEEAQKNA